MSVEAHIGVATAPGEIELTRMPCGLPSSAATRVKKRMAALLVP
jgi:hypothetical protein